MCVLTLVDCAVSVLSVGRWREGSTCWHTLTYTPLFAHTRFKSCPSKTRKRRGKNTAMTVSFLTITSVWAAHTSTLALRVELPAWGIRPYLGHKDGVCILFVPHLTHKHTHTHTWNLMTEIRNEEETLNIEKTRQTPGQGIRRCSKGVNRTEGTAVWPLSLWRFIVAELSLVKSITKTAGWTGDSVLRSALQLSPWAVG